MFAKVFTQIFDSSIAEDPNVRHLFMDLLVLADADGIVDMTVGAISSRTRIPKEDVLRWLEALERPDPESRSQTEQGRRIVRLDDHRTWGWRLVNYRKYRESASKEMLRMVEAERKRAYRERHGGKSLPNTPSSKTEEEAEAEADRSIDMSRTVPDMSRTNTAAHTPNGCERPSLQEVLTLASREGLGAWKAEDWWNEMEGCGWLDYNRRPIQNWQAVFRRVKVKWEADGRPTAPQSRQASANAQGSFWEQSKRLEIVEKELKRMEDAAAHDAFGPHYSDEDKATRRQLIAERNKLKEVILKGTK